MDGTVDATGGVKIGNNVLLGPNVKIISSYYDYTDTQTLFIMKSVVINK